MKKILMSLVAVLILSVGAQAQLLTWDTFGNLGSETNEPSTTNAVNISAADLTFGAGVAPAANGGRFGGNNWFDAGDTVAGTTLAESIAGNDFLQFVVTPDSGFQFTATSFVFNWQKSSTGPGGLALRSSFDGFATDLGTPLNITVTTLTTGNTFTFTSLNDITVATTFRLFGYGATAATGTAGFDSTLAGTNVQLNGTVSAIPEPSTYALLGLGLVALFFLRRRKGVVTK